jgi:DNA-binding transcriptional LysR family regulator
MLDWNDLRYFLAVARTGSTLAASKQLKVSQATVSRRISVLEEAIGAELFVRSPSGYSLSSRGEAVLPSAEAVEESILAFSDGIAAETRRLSGTVRLTTVESAAQTWIAPALALLRRNHPDIKVELVTSDDNLDLARGEADVAIRFGTKPVEETLIVRHIIDLEEAVYASHDLVARLGMPATIADLSRYPMVMGLDPVNWFNSWLSEQVRDVEVAHRANTLSGIIAGVKMGLGASMLPCLMGDNLKGLVRLLPPIPELTTSGWMVTTDHARKQPHVRAVIDFVVEQIQAPARQSPAHLSVVRAA